MVVQWHIYESPYRAVPGSGTVEPVILEYPLEREPGPGSSYSARVRTGVFFSDGTEVTPTRVAASLNKAPTFTRLARASARGDRVVFTLVHEDARFELTLARQDHAIVLERGGEFLGTGPYRIAAGAQPESFRLVPNPFYAGPVGIPEVECRVFPRDETGRPRRLIEALRQGEVDFTDLLSREELNQVAGMRKSIDTGFSTAILFFNTERPLLADPAVRLAMAEAVDRRVLAGASFTYASAFAATGLLPPVMGSTPDGIGHDLERARRRLREAGVTPLTTPLRLVAVPEPRPHLLKPLDTAESIASQLGDLGFRVDAVQARDVDHYFDTAVRGNYDLMLSGWIPDTPDPLDFFEALLASSSIPDGSAGQGRNLSRWRSPDMDRALAAHRARREPESWREIVDLVRSEVPLLPLMYGPRVVVVSRGVKKLPESFGYRPFLAEMAL